MNKQELKKQLEKMGLNKSTIDKYVSGGWGIPKEIYDKLKEKKENAN